MTNVNQPGDQHMISKKKYPTAREIYQGFVLVIYCMFLVTYDIDTNAKSCLMMCHIFFTSKDMSRIMLIGNNSSVWLSCSCCVQDQLFQKTAVSRWQSYYWSLADWWGDCICDLLNGVSIRYLQRQWPLLWGIRERDFVCNHSKLLNLFNAAE